MLAKFSFLNNIFKGPKLDIITMPRSLKNDDQSDASDIEVSKNAKSTRNKRLSSFMLKDENNSVDIVPSPSKRARRSNQIGEESDIKAANPRRSKKIDKNEDNESSISIITPKLRARRSDVVAVSTPTRKSSRVSTPIRRRDLDPLGSSSSPKVRSSTKKIPKSSSKKVAPILEQDESSSRKKGKKRAIDDDDDDITCPNVGAKQSKKLKDPDQSSSESEKIKKEKKKRKKSSKEKEVKELNGKSDSSHSKSEEKKRKKKHKRNKNKIEEGSSSSTSSLNDVPTSGKDEKLDDESLLMKVFYSDDDEVDKIIDQPNKFKRIHKSSQSSQEEDEAVGFFGKYKEAATVRVEKRRGELKGSQVFGFNEKGQRGKPLTAAIAKSTDRSEAYFDSQACNVETSDKTLNQLKTPKLTQEEIDELLKNEPLQFEEEIGFLFRDYHAKFPKWNRLLKEDFNIVVYGFGSKKVLLQEFHSEILADKDCLVVNGFFPSLTIKHVLAGITEDIFEMPDETFGNVSDHAHFICQIMDEREDNLYLIVNNIDGPCLRNTKSQDIFAKLSSHPKIHLICSIDHINAPLIWDQQKLTKFNFAWFDTTTFMPYREETRYENSFMVTRSGALELSSLIHVFTSLNQNAKEIFIKIVKHQIEAGDPDSDESSKHFNGIPFPELYQRCRSSFLVNSDLTLRAQLTEYKDHKLVSIKKGSDGIECLSIPLKQQTLLEFLETLE